MELSYTRGGAGNATVLSKRDSRTIGRRLSQSRAIVFRLHVAVSGMGGQYLSILSSRLASHIRPGIP